MKEIPLTQGRVALVDDEDYYWLSRHKWCAFVRPGKTPYGHRGLWINKRATTCKMHRAILACPAGFEVDHIDGNGLNNQKSNLRICHPSQNKRNNKSYTRSVGFKGVRKNYRKFSARIRHDGKEIYLGTFHSAEDAARAYDAASIKLHGEFARTNKDLGLI